MKELLEEYQETLRNVKRERKNSPNEESAIWRSMVESLTYTIKWLDTGWEPVSRRTEAGFMDSSTFEDIGSVNYFNPFARNAYEEVERKIDEERKRVNRG